jgi:hypothetical protein
MANAVGFSEVQIIGIRSWVQATGYSTKLYFKTHWMIGAGLAPQAIPPNGIREGSGRNGDVSSTPFRLARTSEELVSELDH